MNRQEAARLVSVSMAACPSQSHRLDPERAKAMVDSWAALLADVPYEQASKAIGVLLQTKVYMPSVAEIRSAVAELTAGPVRTGAEAWGDVLRLIGRYGAYRLPGVDFTFDDPIVARCVAAFGWGELCLSENTVADRARFIDAYDRIATQRRREDLSPQLAAARDARRVAGPQEIGRLLEKVNSDD